MVAEWRADGRAFHSATIVGAAPYRLIECSADGLLPSRHGGFMTKHDPMAILLLLTSGAFLTTTLVFAALWLRARERALRLALMGKSAPETRSAEIEHLVHAVDTIAVEVERISQAQRFTAQVLAERIEPEQPLVKGFSGRVSNPH